MGRFQNPLTNGKEKGGDNFHFIGVDVGTGSVRACVIDRKGDILALVDKPISREELKPGFITQSSEEIWDSICFCVRKVIADAKIPANKVIGIGFDATCSLAVVDKDTLEGLAVGPQFSKNDQNIIMWMDHRASQETDEINSIYDAPLKYVGGKMSIEMEMPKIKWLKNHMPRETFRKAVFFDLPDYLTFKATGMQNRSLCSAVCKQGLLPIGVEGSTEGWSRTFLSNTGLPELIENEFERIGGPGNNSRNFLSAGEYVSTLSKSSGEQLGLTESCVVGSGLIDAYAGLIGTIAARIDESARTQDDANGQDLQNAIGRLAAVAGTSTCHITLSDKPIFVNGVWGPYKDILAKDYWCAEGGQSCTGELLKHVITTHPAYEELKIKAAKSKLDLFECLNEIIRDLAEQKGTCTILELTKGLFLYGDYHGNRSPIADPRMRASIIGQSMDTTVESLALIYLAACEFIAHQTRHIITKMNEAGHSIRSIYMSGGQCRNNILMELLADFTGLPVVIPKYIDAAVVFGAALIGATAWDVFNQCETNDDRVPQVEHTLWNAMVKMTGNGTTIAPKVNRHASQALLNTKYKIYMDMAKTQKKYRSLIDDSLSVQ
ncbi:hypothetical protein KAFR_0B05560 [Kazachstania africana CBS 2517]|uniref:Carbohydrate kinase FGGY C-terminal domain-containing protein n=1 Tax=Kazachstania africana (strain ATCC 22294 / BCRC 22015 / CBS 2517 / CECT 1963 / NBRC 1671 / NRRL Y-8276) TaxID=1071382 RepID=H2AR51_KAZAF|nr:hypothetical protein KAFR_0B05560 [Kazachstania africana CBS 2517]CCF56851.1 hypothetical protein KAFR_0B05560 [Kazachstania africana CBS 2517]